MVVGRRAGEAVHRVGFGVLVTREARPGSLEELIEPALAARLDRLDVLSRKIFAGKLPGERHSKRRGRSVEFDDFRTYTPGDDLRHIDWNVYARLDKLIIKLFREEEDLALQVVVDASASMHAGKPGKLVFACRVAMALAYIGLVNSNRVSVATFGDAAGVRALAPLRGRAGLTRVAGVLLEALERPEPAGVDGSGRFAEDLKRLAGSRSGRGVTVVLSDFLVAGEHRGWLNALAASTGGAAFDTHLLQVLAPGELDPMKEPGVTGDVRLTDIETGRAAEVTLSEAAVATYKLRVREFHESLRKEAMARGLGCFLVPTDTPVDVLVLDSLRRGGILR